MSNLLKSKFFLGALVVAVMFVGAVAVKATTASADCAATITSTLKVGSSGAQVSCLQTIVGATADGAFGPMTKAAVMAWQSGHGLTADGVVGPMTRAALMGAPTGNFPAGCTSASGYSTTTGAPCNTGTSAGLPAGCSSTVGYSPLTGTKCDSGSTSTPTGPLAGTDGTISDINRLSQYNAEEVGSGQEDVKVLGFEVEASNDGDIQINSVKLRFDSNGNNSLDSDRLEDYLDGVTVWMGSKEVGSVDVEDFTKDSTGLYTKVVSLSGAVVRADETESFYVSVDAVNNLDSGDIDSDSWTIAVDNLRFVDGGGVVTTETSAIPTDMDWDAAGDGVALAFVSFSSASDTELKVSTNSTPAAGSLKADDTDDTEGVVLLKGKLKLEGDSDVLLDALPITLTSTGDSISALTSSVTLTIDGEEFTESTGANCIDDTDFDGADSCDAATVAGVLFDNLDLDIAAGETVNFTVSADINDLENTGVTATDFDAGDSLTASLTTTGRGYIVAENEQGDQLTDSSEMTGSAIGEAQSFYADGVNVDMGTTTYTSVTDSGTVTQVTYSIPLTVTSFGDTRYVGLSAEYEADALAVNDDLALAFELQDSTAPTTGLENGTVSSTFTCDATLESGTAYRLDEGDSVNCTLQVIHTTPGTASRSYRVAVNEFQTYSDAALNTDEVIQTLTPVQDFQTGYQFITG